MRFSWVLGTRLIKVETKCQPGYGSHWELEVFFQPHSDCWQNSVPCDGRTEFVVVFVDIVLASFLLLAAP